MTTEVMTEASERPIAYISVSGIETSRDGAGLVPCGYGVVFLSGGRQRHFRGAAFVKDTQDCYAYGIQRTFDENNMEVAERPGTFTDESIDFRVLSAGFVRKLGESADASANDGLAASGKPYHSFAVWNHTNAVKLLGDSTITKVTASSDVEQWAAQGARRQICWTCPSRKG